VDIRPGLQRGRLTPVQVESREMADEMFADIATLEDSNLQAVNIATGELDFDDRENLTKRSWTVEYCPSLLAAFIAVERGRMDGSKGTIRRRTGGRRAGFRIVDDSDSVDLLVILRCPS
jgi:hypothetical protein